MPESVILCKVNSFYLCREHGDALIEHLSTHTRSSFAGASIAIVILSRPEGTKNLADLWGRFLPSNLVCPPGPLNLTSDAVKTFKLLVGAQL